MEGIEKFQLMESKVNGLLAQDVSQLLPYQVSDMNGRLLEASVSLGALVSETPALAGSVEEVQKRISEKRTALNMPPVADLDEEAAPDLSAVESLLEAAPSR